MRVERHRRLILLAGGAVLLLIVMGSAVAWGLARDPGKATDLLPNLVQATPGELTGRTGGTAAKPRFFLGFESAAANAGAGPLVVLGARSARQTRMTLRQQIRRSDGSTRSVRLRSRLRYVHSPDHSHWHVLDFMRYELRAAKGSRVVHDRKTGFCLGDRYQVRAALPGAGSRRYSDRCGKGAPGLRRIREGISVGWGDNYTPHLEGQELELTGLPAGRYVLVHRVNPARDFRESSYSDNVASMALAISWPRGRKLPPRVDVVLRCPETATCP